jgi:chromosome segregation ATPase
VLNLTGANEHPHSEKGSTTSAELSNIQSKLRLALFQAKEEKEKADRLEAENLEYKRNVAELTSQVDNLERKGKNAKMQLDNSLRKLKTESEANADLQAQMQQVLEIIKEKEVATKKIVDQLGGVKALQQQNVRLKQEVSSKNDDVVLLESRLMECESQVGFLLQSAEQLVFLIEEMCAQEGLEVRRASHEKPDDSTHDKVYHRLHFVSENLVVIVEYIQSLKVQLTECSKKLRSSESQVLKLSAELESTRHAERSASPTSSPQSPDSDGKTSKKK